VTKLSFKWNASREVNLSCFQRRKKINLELLFTKTHLHYKGIKKYSYNQAI
jgi:hypothetical protein